MAVLTSTADQAAPAPVVMGIVRGDAAKYNVEFQRHDPAVPIFREGGVSVSLVEMAPLVAYAWASETIPGKIEEHLRPYHVITLTTTHEGLKKFGEAEQRRAAAVGEGLKRYVEAGGGLLLHPAAVRYPGDDDDLYWNAVLKPLGLELLHEGVYDATRSFEGPSLHTVTFWRTRNIVPHPVTEQVAGLCLPLHNYYPGAGVPAMRYGPEWEVVVRGEAEARSFRSGTNNRLNLEAPGSYDQSPPVVAVRNLGKGRIVCYPLPEIYTTLNLGNPLWAHVVERRGDTATGHPSDSLRLILNACRWLAEPAQGVPELGTFRPVPFQPITYPPTVDFDPGAAKLSLVDPAAAPPAARVVIGAHSSLSDGKGSVAEFAAAARAAGLRGIVFTDPLELLTRDKLAQLMADCAAASEEGVFYACPGIEFTDGTGTRWAFWGETLVWPDDAFMSGKFKHVQWDGKRVNHYGQYATACRYPGSAILDYKQLRANGAHPENLWWFSHLLPRVYDHGRLVADNHAELLSALRGMYQLVPLSFTRVTAPGEVAAAAELCYTGLLKPDEIRAVFNTRFTSGASHPERQFVSQGPEVVEWRAENSQMEENWKLTRGAQRVPLRFVVRSGDGIAEVLVHDADHGPVRRYLGHGEKLLVRDFEIVHDQQHYLALEVIDTKGRRAFSGNIRVYCYKSGLFRCGDNLNILGPTAMCWHPDRNQPFEAAKYFRNGIDLALRGWDTSEAALGVPGPGARLWGLVTLKEAGGEFPVSWRDKAMPSRLMDVGVNNYDIQIASMRMERLAEPFDDEKRPTPSRASPPRDVADNPYFTQSHTLVAPMERVNMFTAWNHRRGREALKDYRGGILWHEGEFRFKKDVTLQGDVPLPLLDLTCPVDFSRNIGTLFIVTDAGKGTRVVLADNVGKKRHIVGRIKPGGYAAHMTTPVGYHGLLVPAGVDFAYSASVPATRSLFGLGRGGEVIKAGTVLPYRFGVATFAGGAPGNELLEETVRVFNLDGGRDGYPVAMRTGEVVDALFFFTAQAAGNEVEFTLGPAGMIIDLPIRVRGLTDNGCAAIYSTHRPWFRFIPVDHEGTAWLTEPIEKENAIWVGNVFTCDLPEIKLTLVVDGQAKGKAPMIEVHNPTDEPITTRLSAAAHAPVFAGLRTDVTVPAGDSLWLMRQDGKLVPRGEHR